MVIDIVSNGAVDRSFPVFIRFLVAYENIKRLFIFDNRKNVLLDAVDCPSFGFVDVLLIGIRIIYSSQIVRVGRNRIEKRSVAGWDALEGFWVPTRATMRRTGRRMRIASSTTTGVSASTTSRWIR